MALPAIAPYPMPGPDRLPAARVDWTPDPARAVLLVHDLQNYFLSALPPAAQSPTRELLANTAALRDRCHALGVPVLYSAQPAGQTPAERGLQQDFWGPGLPAGGVAAHIVPAVAPGPGDAVLTKWKYSAFVRTGLEERMRAAGRDQLVITGVYAHIGVLATACDAWMRDIRAFVVADAVADFSERDHHAALAWAAGRCARVLPAADVFPAAPQSPALPLERLRADVAALLGEPPSDIAPDDDLLDLGLDSVRLMTLVERWRGEGAQVTFVELAEHRTLEAWCALLAPSPGPVRSPRAAAAPGTGDGTGELAPSGPADAPEGRAGTGCGAPTAARAEVREPDRSALAAEVRAAERAASTAPGAGGAQ